MTVGEVEPGPKIQPTAEVEFRESEGAHQGGRTLAAIKPESNNARMRAVLATIRRAAQSNVPVLLRGETGTGKTALAEVLHAESPRRERPFVVVNCPNLSDELVANECFGNPEGVFAGATKGSVGRLEATQGGTLFWDEIGEMPASLQAKVLPLVEIKKHESVSEGHTQSRRVRVVAATSRNLEEDIKGGRFRQDLFFRLSVVEINIPPLRERSEDILPLARHFVEVLAARTGGAVQQFSKSAADLLCSYAWPGNVRELRNAIERAVMLWPAHVIEAEAFPARMVRNNPPQPFVGGDFATDEVEQEHIMRVIQRTPTLERAAAILGIDYTTLWRKRKRYLADRLAEKR
jgi:NtrC-family two-component system response regulator AlgB